MLKSEKKRNFGVHFNVYKWKILIPWRHSDFLRKTIHSIALNWSQSNSAHIQNLWCQLARWCRCKSSTAGWKPAGALRGTAGMVPLHACPLSLFSRVPVGQSYPAVIDNGYWYNVWALTPLCLRPHLGPKQCA